MYKLALLVAVAALHSTVDVVVAQTLDLGTTTTPVATATANPAVTAATVNPVTAATANPAATNVAVQTQVPGQTTVQGQTAVPGATGTAAPTEEGWRGCDNPTLSREENLVKLGERTTICLVLSSSAEWNIPPPSATTLRLSFQPVADQYSRFHVTECESSPAVQSTVMFLLLIQNL